MHTKNQLVRRTMIVALSALLGTTAFAQVNHDHGTPVQIQGSEYKFTGPAAFTTGWQTVEFKNTGQEPHHIQIARLPSGTTLPAFLQQLRTNEGAALASIDMVGGVGLLIPGQSQRATLNFAQPGTYVELCFMPDAKGVPHLVLGMVSSFEVTKATQANVTLPKADLKVKLQDFGFELPRGAVITEGPQVWEVENAGPEGHEMIVFMVAPGKTMADVTAYLQKPEGAMPAIPMGGAQGVSKGGLSYAHLNLAPGEYFLMCAIPSPAKGGAPHFALGMIRPFKVVAKTAVR